MHGKQRERKKEKEKVGILNITVKTTWMRCSVQHKSKKIPT